MGRAYLKTTMPKIDSTSDRSNALAALAEAILSERGIDVTTPTPHATLLEMYSELAEREGCHKETAKRHIARAMRRARGEIVKARGGYRPVASGEHHHNAMLTDAQVADMRAAFANGASIGDLANQYGVKYATAYAIVTERNRVRAEKSPQTDP